MTDRLKIGISACFFHADPARPIFTGKTLQYIEQSIAHWVMSQRRAAGDDPVAAGRAPRAATVDAGRLRRTGSTAWC